MTAMLLAVCGAVTALAVRHLAVTAARYLRGRRRPERVEECTCGAQMPISKAHIVSAVFADDPEIASLGGMTAVSAAYCRRHCPGGCNHPKEHRGTPKPTRPDPSVIEVGWIRSPFRRHPKEHR